MDDLENTASPEAGAEVVSTPAPTPSLASDDDSALEALYDQITSRDDSEAEKPATAPAEVTSSTDQPQNEVIALEGTPASDAPHSWSAEAKVHWANIPPEARAYIAQRESSAHEQISRMGQEIARYRPLGELISAKQEVFDRNGIAPIEGLNKLFEAQELLEQNPIQGVMAIASQFGIDLQATFGGQGQDGQAGDPQSQALAYQNRVLQQRLAQVENTAKAQADREQQARRVEAQSAVEKWSAGKTHFANSEVKTLMATLMGNGSASTLDDAYDKACHAIPSIREIITAEARKADEAKKLEDAAKAAADAKKARGMNAGNRPGKPAKGGKWDDDASLEATYDRIAS